jgi:large subunit ribosomal protein L40
VRCQKRTPTRIKKKNLISFLRNFLLKSCSATARALHTSSPVCITSTPVLFAEPLKKKKKLDPQVIKHREERKRKKLEKQIRRLERNARQLKPIEELEVPLTLLDEKKYVISLSI